VGPLPVTWSRRAQRDRERIHAFIAQRFGAAEANRVVTAIAEYVLRLATHPDSGRQIGVTNGFPRRESVMPRLPYVIEYERQPTRIRVVYIWHQSQDRHRR
jgi:plasmid stabilization system protein ParE